MNYRNLLVGIAVGTRIATSIVTIFQPLIGQFLSFCSDILDYPLIYLSGLTFKKYHQIDKLLDFAHYIFIWITVIFVVKPNSTVLQVLLFLFIFRAVGQLLYLKKHNRRYFIIFPNFFEYYFFFYLVEDLFEFGININGLSFWVVLIVFKMLQEITNNYIFEKDYNFVLKFIVRPLERFKVRSMPANDNKNK